MSEWEWLMYWCNIRARITGTRQKVYACKVGDGWQYWSTAAGAGYGTSGDSVRQEIEGKP